MMGNYTSHIFCPYSGPEGHNGRETQHLCQSWELQRQLRLHSYTWSCLWPRELWPNQLPSNQLIKPFNPLILQSTKEYFSKDTQNQPHGTISALVADAPTPPGPSSCRVTPPKTGSHAELKCASWKIFDQKLLSFIFGAFPCGEH